MQGTRLVQGNNRWQLHETFKDHSSLGKRDFVERFFNESAILGSSLFRNGINSKGVVKNVLEAGMLASH